MAGSKHSFSTGANIMSPVPKNGHATAYSRWFAGLEKERKARHIAPGRKVPGFPAPPAGPEEVRRVVEIVGEARAIELCGIHRTTLGRWLDGSVQIPKADYAVLLFHADGVPPGCGDHWRGFHWSGNALTCPDGRTTLAARELEGWQYKIAHIEALQRRVATLDGQLVEMARRLGTDGAANDSFSGVQDVRTRAFLP